MSADPTGLNALHDILVPPPTPWWPPAPGWYWVLGVASVIGAVLLWRAAARWQRNRYRREALAELASIEAQLKPRTDTRAHTGSPGDLSPDAALAAMAVLLKRTALTAYPRERVAGLTGDAWFAFLDQTGGTRFSAGPGLALAQASYLADGAASESTGEVASEIRRWIQQHGNIEPTPPIDNKPSEAA